MNQGPYYFNPFASSYLSEDNQDIDFAIYSEFYTPELALKHGNSFKKKYLPYKNYLPNIPKCGNEKEELERKIQMFDLISHDLKMHLDIYPTDREVFSLYKKYVECEEKALKEYQEKYQTICVKDAKFDSMFSWVRR